MIPRITQLIMQQSRYLELFLHEVEERSNRSKKLTLWSLDFVRLNIIADKP